LCSGGSAARHVGFYWGKDAHAYHVLGCNQSDAVTVTRISKHRLLDARWPLNYAHKIRPILLDAKGQPLSLNEATMRLHDMAAIAAGLAVLFGAFQYGRHWEAKGQERAIERLEAHIEAADARARDAAMKLIETERQAADLATTLEGQAN
jgi:hypothetical protein